MLNRALKLFGTAALVLSLAACGKDSTGSDDSTRGSIAFRYSGALSGGFEAEGEYGPSNTPGETFSAAVQSGDSLFLVGTEGRGGSRYDLFGLQIAAERGTATCRFTDPSCELFSIFMLNVSEADERTDGFFVGFSGTVNVTSLSNSRARGTFSLTMLDLDDFSGATELEVRSGTFDVPIIRDNLPTLNRAPAARQLNRMRLLRTR